MMSAILSPSDFSPGHRALLRIFANPKESSHRGKESPMMKRHTNVGNRLLAALPPADLGLLAPYLQQVSLKQDAVLVRSGDRNEQVYFPHSGTISFMLDMPNGQTVATAVIGHEAGVGMLSVLGPSRSPTTAVGRAGGVASASFPSRVPSAFCPRYLTRHARPH